MKVGPILICRTKRNFWMIFMYCCARQLKTDNYQLLSVETSPKKLDQTQFCTHLGLLRRSIGHKDITSRLSWHFLSSDWGIPTSNRPYTSEKYAKMMSIRQQVTHELLRIFILYINAASKPHTYISFFFNENKLSDVPHRQRCFIWFMRFLKS